MHFYNDVMRAERERTMDYGRYLHEESLAECPECGSCDWDFLMKDVHGDIIGCEDCVTKIYPEEMRGEEAWDFNEEE